MTKKAIELALEGDTTCLKLCLDRILPKARPVPVEIEEYDHTPDGVIRAVTTLAYNAAEAGDYGSALSAWRLVADMQGSLKGNLPYLYEVHQKELGLSEEPVVKGATNVPAIVAA